MTLLSAVLRAMESLFRRQEQGWVRTVYLDEDGKDRQDSYHIKPGLK